MVLYKPEVFWIHFTGRDVKNILAYHGITLDEHVFYCGVLPDYKALSRKIIPGVAAVPLWVRGLYRIAVQRYSAVGGSLAA